MASNIILIALGILDKRFEKTMLIKSTFPLDHTPPPKSLGLYCKKISKVKNELNGQPSSLLASMHVSNYKTTFSPMHLVFSELDTHRHHLDFKIPDENNNEVIPRTFYLQLLNKQ